MPVDYRGPFAITAKTGPAARTEYENFKLRQPGWPYFGTFRLGDDKENYFYPSSMVPVIERVSPEAVALVNRSQKWRRAGMWLIGSALISLSAVLLTEHRGTKNDLAAVSVGLSAASVVSNVVSFSILGNAADRYNEDLKQKLTPALSLNWPY